MKLTKLLLLLISIALMIALIACASPAPSTSPAPAATQESEPITYQLAHGRPDSHITGKATLKFKEFVEEASNGRLLVDIYPDAQLYDDRKAPGAISGNYIEFACTSSVVLTGWEPGWDVLSMPFLFKSDQQLYEFTKTAAWQTMLDKTEEKGLKVVSFWPGGSVYFWNRVRPIESIDDFNGIKTRVLESQIHKAIVAGVGANPIPISLPEVYTALQQGMVDGVFTTADALVAVKWFEHIDYGLTNAMLMVGTGIMISPQAWENLPADLQQVVMEQGRRASGWEAEVFGQHIINQCKIAEEGGVAFNTLSGASLADVQKAVAPIIEEYYDQVGGYLIDAAKAMN